MTVKETIGGSIERMVGGSRYRGSGERWLAIGQRSGSEFVVGETNSASVGSTEGRKSGSAVLPGVTCCGITSRSVSVLSPSCP